jgi:hypothetical protein
MDVNVHRYHATLPSQRKESQITELVRTAYETVCLFSKQQIDVFELPKNKLLDL